MICVSVSLRGCYDLGVLPSNNIKSSLGDHPKSTREVMNTDIHTNLGLLASLSYSIIIVTIVTPVFVSFWHM